MNDSIFCHQYCLWHFSWKWTFRRFVFKVTSYIITNSYSSHRVQDVVQQNSILGLSSHQPNTYYIALHHSFFDPLQLVKLGFARRAAPRATAKQCGHPEWPPCAIGASGCQIGVLVVHDVTDAFLTCLYYNIRHRRVLLNASLSSQV